MSVARLAAEAAFAAPPAPLSPQPSAQVMVRRTRSAGLAAKAAPANHAGSANEPTPRGARVFRVHTALPKTADTALLAAAQAPADEGQGRANPVPPNATRIASNKRPGPVVHVMQASTARPTAATPQPRQSLLVGMLQSVSPDLALIAHAQAFSLVDAGLHREWLRLSRQADELHVEILTQLR